MKTDVMVIFHGFYSFYPPASNLSCIPANAVIQIIGLKMACCYIEHKPAQTTNCQPPDQFF
ncbi:hypothetical protein [Chryseobacterium indologenes]|uniref:Uncharacterized protein n=1 Tax=Chryseobacterium indologenes TaxID=253 RepID=A0A0N0IY54_CHRID|nr:hypothetical protein [Chryseobacterium indologenes]KPE52802.1 hypothetical protein AOB46_02055 [Chryseobacterium indologenes]